MAAVVRQYWSKLLSGPALFRLCCKLGVSNHPLALYLDPWLTLYSLVNHISDYMLINSGFPFVPTAAHPLTEMMNALIAAYSLTHMLTDRVCSSNTACTVEGVFCYFRQRAALCQPPLSISLFLSLPPSPSPSSHIEYSTTENVITEM